MTIARAGGGGVAVPAAPRTTQRAHARAMSVLLVLAPSAEP